MKVISTFMHGIMDYLGGALLIAAPFVLGFANNGPAMWVPIALGGAMIGVALFTDYELSLVRSIPMSMHLTGDMAMGLLLAASPWLFQFSEVVWMPHVILGIAEIGGAMMTQTTPSRAMIGSH